MKLRWKLHRKFAGGFNCVTIKPTMACNYNCPYCCAAITRGYKPKFDKQFTPDEWIEKLKIFGKINVVSISGGEPMLYPHIDELVYKLLDNGYWVRIMTNLSWNMTFVPTCKLQIIASFHPTQVAQVSFDMAFSHFSKRYNMEYRRIGVTNIKVYNTDDRLKKKSHFHPVIAPDGTVYGSCVDLERGGK